MKCLSRDPEIIAQERLQIELSLQSKYQPFVHTNEMEFNVSGSGTNPKSEVMVAVSIKSCKEMDEKIPSLYDENKSEDDHLDIKQDIDVGELKTDRKSEEKEALNKIEEGEGLVKIETEPDIDEFLTPPVQKRRRLNINKIPAVAQVCPICAKEVKYLNGHIKEVHTETPHENHICNDCGKAFGTKKKLRGHIDTIHKMQPTMCPICAKEVKYLNAHIKIVHTDTPAKNLICDDCGKVFSTSKKLRGHVNATHKMLPSMCEICCQVLKNPHSLRGHKRKVHEEINEVTCPSCFKVFDTQQKLYYHERAVHTLEDSRCEACGRTYKNRNLLQKHQRVYHKELYEAQTKYFENTNAANSINGTLGMSSTPVNAHPMNL
eukprot:GFUD01032728.1.p1 GENE.GFUD01032728.1~~GFUD01032728.1.p1  ORF type:complete len:437 (+),score=88.72 GFUD01032728.1:186-1313(+)